MKVPERITRHHLKKIFKCARFSHDVYERMADFDTNVFRHSLHNRLVHGNSTSLAVIAESPSSLYIVFRGTDFSDKSQVMSDVKISKISEPNIGEVAVGFRQELDYMYSDLFVILSAIVKDTKKPVYVTGHSLGGALANLCAARLSLHAMRTNNLSYLPAGLVTFGSPRVGDRDFAKHMHLAFTQMDTQNQNRIGICRFRNNNDVVARLPTPLRGYCHAGDCIYITPSGDMHDNPWWHRRIWWSVVGAGLRFLSDQFEDHRMKNYLAKVETVYNYYLSEDST